MKAPIHSVKHLVQFPIDGIPTGTRQAITLLTSVESTVANLANEVPEGSVIKAIYIELWLQNTSNLGESIVTLCKDIRLGIGPTFAEMASLFTYTNKKNVLFTHQGLTSNDGVSGPVRILQQWIKIPKGKQRMGLGDQLILSISNTSANDLNRCGIAIYKEYT